jgi:hypothetical protein
MKQRFIKNCFLILQNQFYLMKIFYIFIEKKINIRLPSTFVLLSLLHMKRFLFHILNLKNNDNKHFIISKVKNWTLSYDNKMNQRYVSFFISISFKTLNFIYIIDSNVNKIKQYELVKHSLFKILIIKSWYDLHLRAKI